MIAEISPLPHNISPATKRNLLQHIPSPNLEKIKKIALEILFIGGIAILEATAPLANLALWLIGQVSTWVITDRNIKQIKMQKLQGFEPDLAHQALKAVKNSFNLQQIVNRQIVTTIVVSLVMQTASIIFGIIELAFCTWYILKTHSRINCIQKEIEIKKNEQLCIREKSTLEKLYGPDMKLYANQERKRRDYKRKYLIMQRTCISIAWEKLLHSKKINVEQGISFDPEVMPPLCKMAVLEELNRPAILSADTCPPTLTDRMKQIKDARKLYLTLTPEEKASIEKIALEEECPKQNQVKQLSSMIQKLAWGMFQLPIFKKPVRNGSERYCLKTLKLISLLELEKDRFLDYKNQLIFSKA